MIGGPLSGIIGMPGAVKIEDRPAVKAMIEAFGAEGIFFDPADPQDRRRFFGMEHQIANDAAYPPDHLRFQMVGTEKDPLDTRSPVEQVAQAAGELITALRAVIDVARAPEPPDRINVSERFIQAWPEQQRCLTSVLLRLEKMQDVAACAVGQGEPPPAHRPRLLHYESFVGRLTRIYEGKTGTSALTESGKARAEFARIVLGLEFLLPEALRARELSRVSDRIAAAVPRLDKGFSDGLL